MPERWHIEMLGGLRARWRDCVADRFRSQKTGSLLAYLALHPGRMHTREVLADLLWPRSDSRAARTSLSSALYSLRRQMEVPGLSVGEVFRTTRSAIGLNAGAVGTDVAEFVTACKEARAASGAARVALLQRAVEAYDGEFLPGHYEDWVAPEQRRLAEMHHEAIGHLVAAMEAAGDLHGAIAVAARGVRADPLCEEAHRELIRLHLAAGHVQVARRVYADLKALLARELQAVPLAATRALLERAEGRAGPGASGAGPLAKAPAPVGAAGPVMGTFAVLLGGGEGLAEPPRLPWPQVAEQVRKHGGFGVGAGRPLPAGFGCVEAALACAVALHRMSALENDAPAMSLRLALDSGRLVRRGESYRGAVLERAHRLLEAARPGIILCSERAASVALLELDPRLSLRDLGSYGLTKGARPERLYSVEYAGMPCVQGSPVRGLMSRRGSVPRPLTRLIGRDADLERLTALLRSASTRLVTLLGPAGVGKTRLAIEVAQRAASLPDVAVWFVPLADEVAAERIVPAILGVVGFDGEIREVPEERLIRALSFTPSVLVVDALEHLLPDGAALVARLLERVPELRCLATSRRKLGVPGEQAVPLEPLPTPDAGLPPDELRDCPSVELFVERAEAAMPGFRLDSGNAPAVARLCKRLEGVPLSLELAAARVGVVTPAQMLDSAGTSLQWLVTSDEHRPARQRSVRAAIEASVGALPARLRAFFARLSVFRGGWTLEAAEQVCRAPHAADHLAQLRDVSLVSTDSAGSALRFRLLEIVREFAGAEVCPDEQEGLLARHAEHFRSLAGRAEPELDGPRQMEWMERLDGELANFRAALAWALAAHPHWALEMAADLGHFWEVRGHLLEGRDWLEQALAAAPGAPLAVRTRAVLLTGWFAHILGEPALARERTWRGLELSRRAGDLEATGMALYALAWMASAAGDLAESRRLCEQSAAVARKRADPQALARAYDGLVSAAYAQGDFEAARRHGRRALAVRRRQVGPRGTALALTSLGKIEIMLGNWETGRGLCEEGIEMLRRMGDVRSVGSVLAALGELALGQGQIVLARDWLEQALSAARQAGGPVDLAMALGPLAEAALAQNRLGDARERLEECAEVHRKLRDARSLALVLSRLATVAEREDDPEEAVRRLAAAERLLVGTRSAAPEVGEVQRRLQGFRDALGGPVFERARQEGRGEAGDEPFLAC